MSTHKLPVYAVWETTLACDMACSHCGSRGGKAREDELNTAEALDLICQLSNLGVADVTLIGGEAYLRDDWLELIRRIRAKGMKATFTTGGRTLTAQQAKDAVDAGLEAATVSLDGLQVAHDTQRAKGSFDAAIRALRAFRAAGLTNLGVNTQINRYSLPNLEALLDVIANEGVTGWRVQFTVPMGRAADHPEALLIQPFELLEVMPRIAKLATEGAKRNVRLFAGNNVGYFGPFEDLLRGSGRPDGYSEGCAAGVDLVGIEADGTIKGCPGLPTKAYGGGNIRKSKLRDIVLQSSALRFARDKAAPLWGFCKGCYYADLCRGGCTWTAHTLFGRPGNNPYCHHRVLELAEQGKRERLVVAETPRGRLPFDHGRFELVEEPLPGFVPDPE